MEEKRGAEHRRRKIVNRKSEITVQNPYLKKREKNIEIM